MAEPRRQWMGGMGTGPIQPIRRLILRVPGVAAGV